MNKIVIVGHPASGHEEALSLLQESGMTAALPSRREGLLPEDITSILCKAHKMPPLEDVTAEEDFVQVEVAPVWQGMALDLMLGNLEQPLWGWSDPQAIFTLDYWAALDSRLVFVLVYDEPHRVLMEASLGPDEGLEAVSEQDLERMLENWAAYNGALLRFHMRNPGRSLLMHSQRVRRAADHCVEQLQPLLDAPLSTPADADAVPVIPTSRVLRGPAPATRELSLAFSAAGLEATQASQLLQAASTERYVVDHVLEGHPAITQLYAELQSVANLPVDAPAREARGDARAAWQVLRRQRTFVHKMMVLLQDEVSRNQALLEEEKGSNARVTAELEKQSEPGAESDMLLSEIRRLRKELENNFLRTKELERTKEELSTALDVANRQRRKSNRQRDALQLQSEELGRSLDVANRLRRASNRQRDALQLQLETSLRSPDLSVVPGRRMLSVSLRRLVKKMVPQAVQRSRAFLWLARR